MNGKSLPCGDPAKSAADCKWFNPGKSGNLCNSVRNRYRNSSPNIMCNGLIQLKLPANAGWSVSAAIEKLNEPGVGNNLLSFGAIRNGGAVCECMLLSISSSLFELNKSKIIQKQVNIRIYILSYRVKR